MTDVLNVKELEVDIQNEKIRIKPLKIKHLAKVLKHIALIVQISTKKNIKWLDILSQNADGIIDIISAGANKEIEWVDELHTSEAIKVLRAIVEVNADDFLLQAKPELEAFGEAMQKITATEEKKKK